MSRRGNQMVLQAAFACSAANKAKTTTDKGDTVIVQDRCGAIGHAWLHMWHISEGAVAWADFPSSDLDKLSLYGVSDPYGAIWSPV
jgi:hypothetical protein